MARTTSIGGSVSCASREGSTKVLEFREEQFVDAGIGRDVAVELAHGSANWHRVIEAHQNGCSEKLLLQIFT